MKAWAKDVLHYWFEILGPEDWFGSTQQIDDEIRRRFGPLWQSLHRESVASFIGSAKEALAAIILFDQFPRNIFRDNPDAFASDALALQISRLAIGAGFEQALNLGERHFLYMPFMHSEDIADQDKSVALFDKLGNDDALKFANMHRDMIKRFGRFPHRNKALGRETHPDEAAAIAEGKNW